MKQPQPNGLWKRPGKGHKAQLKKEVPMKRCRYCYATEELTLDHKVPIMAGGSNKLSNLQCLCRRCNGMKSGISQARIKSLFRWHIQIIVEKEERRRLKRKRG